ncbi:type IV pilin protein [Lignipirellula cremea]|uniref:type IV pilin protein n=1 Tax=Lignipirellula cremea TaxID=2528010 RepID=UPI0018D26F49|nr:prepilin-type N-terminal cleavage/methylation domain-containing protein [Lignipirellula cremea]
MRTKREGFTLVEVMIVVVTMAIIAGMVIPQFNEAVQDAKVSAALSNLHMLSNAIENYKVQHDGRAPDDLTGQTLPQLTHRTDKAGNIGTGPQHRYGPYLLAQITANPLNDSAVVSVAAKVPPENLETLSGWIYDPVSGRVWAGEFN